MDGIDVAIPIITSIQIWSHHTLFTKIQIEGVNLATHGAIINR